MHTQTECWILTSKNSAKLKQYYSFHAKFLEEIRYVLNQNHMCTQHMHKQSLGKGRQTYQSAILEHEVQMILPVHQLVSTSTHMFVCQVPRQNRNLKRVHRPWALVSEGGAHHASRESCLPLQKAEIKKEFFWIWHLWFFLTPFTKLWKIALSGQHTCYRQAWA